MSADDAANDCPPEADLAALAAGQLDGPAADRLEAHVAGCSACREVLAKHEISADDTALVARVAPAGEGPESTAAPRSLVGGMVDKKYRMVRMLGQGGMGSVYEAEHTGTGRRVAVKLISRRLLSSGSEGPRRFRREARAAGAIDSPHIVQILDSGADEASGSLYLVMEHLHGEDLQRLIDRVGALPPDVALRVTAQALLGLSKAHEASIVHRDIKPANLFLARRDDGEVTVKLLDFGIAKVTVDVPSHGVTSGITYTGGLLGSPLYMSPEQVQSSKDVDHGADLWSLGAVLYAALTGRAPHADIGSIGKLILAICSTPAPPIRERAPWVPEEAAAVVHRALALDPAQRFPTAAAMLEPLRALLPGGFTLREEMLVGITPEGRAVPAEPGPSSATVEIRSVPPAPAEAAPATPSPSPPAAPEPASPPASPAPSPSRARRVWAGAVVVVMLAIALVGARSWARRKSSIIAEETLASFSALPSRPSGAEDPLAEARVELGRALFFDPRLSKNGDVACTSCHPLDRYGVDNQRLSRGSDGREPPRNTQSVYNTAGFFALLWDGRQTDLAEQAKEVLLSPRAMAASKDRLPEVLRAVPSYVTAFAKAFPDEREPVTFDNTARALAAFEATLVTRGRWDRFLEGDRAALTDEEKAGFNRFVEIGCIACHFGPNVGATMFQKAGLVKAWPDTKDKGRYELTKRDVDFMVFRVPSLRNVTRTGPYFHDGSVDSLDTAIRMMGHHQIGKELDDEDVALIKSWLGCLTGEIPEDLRTPAAR